MRISHILFCCLLAILFIIPGQASSKKKHLKPIGNRKRVTIQIAKKERSYYRLQNDAPARILLRGPGILKVYTRAQFHRKQKEKISYEIKYRMDGGKEISKKFKNVKRSAAATYKLEKLGNPGQLRTIKIKVGDGHHSLEIINNENKIPVAARYTLIPKRQKKVKLVPLTPEKFDQPVDLLSKESTINYYRFSEKNPLQFEIIGPTSVHILTRVENHYNMRGRIQYRLLLRRDGKETNSYQLSSVRSEITSYKSDKNLVPGKARELVIRVPKGKHKYQLLPMDKDKGTILGRILFPAKDVNLED